jgi:hypothetical protein
MIYCHERMQVTDGGMCAIRLAPDLKRAIGPKHLLFKASDANWTDAIDGNQYTTDGPFIHQTSNGHLLLLWSSFHRGNYAVGMARSASGNILGPWLHDAAPLYKADGGHAMIFRTFAGRAMLALHAPGMAMGMERTQLFPLIEGKNELHLAERSEMDVSYMDNKIEISPHTPSLAGAACH